MPTSQTCQEVNDDVKLEHQIHLSMIFLLLPKAISYNRELFYQRRKATAATMLMRRATGALRVVIACPLKASTEEEGDEALSVGVAPLSDVFSAAAADAAEAASAGDKAAGDMGVLPAGAGAAAGLAAGLMAGLEAGFWAALVSDAAAWATEDSEALASWATEAWDAEASWATDAWDAEGAWIAEA